MSSRLNLARRPFVDTRPANLALATLAIVAALLSGLAFRTVQRYYRDSDATRRAIGSLRVEIGRLEEARREREAALSRIDVAALAESARDANALALTGTFSWTRFLTHLERTLPWDVRVTAITLNPQAKAEGATGSGSARRAGEGVDVGLTLVARDPDAVPKLVRAFYASPWFDRPVPLSEQSPDRGEGDGRQIGFSVTYRGGAEP